MFWSSNFQTNYLKQASLNEDLIREISELQQEASLVREIPARLSESVENCKDIFKDVLSILKVMSV